MKIALVFGMKMFKDAPLRRMIDIARQADELGFDYLCLAEHVLMHGHPSLLAHSTGPVMHTPDELMPEPLTTLAAFAGATPAYRPDDRYSDRPVAAGGALGQDSRDAARAGGW